MNIQSRMNRTRSNAAAAKLGRNPDALADPLDNAEWDGLRWSIPVFTCLVAGARPEMGSMRGGDRKIRQVERFTASAGA